MRQIDDRVRLRRRAANLEFGRGPGTRVDPGVLARHIGGSPVCRSAKYADRARIANAFTPAGRQPCARERCPATREDFPLFS